VKSRTQVEARIRRAAEDLGPAVCILGHHYIPDSVIRFADHRGDSLELARSAVKQEAAQFIIFCGVHFMAETAAILARPGQRVILPELSAGCFLADTAKLGQVEEAWHQLDSVMEADQEVVPITYVNSSAELKAFCGKHGGAVCTSSNAAQVLSWALGQRPRVFFFPDQHLGRNTVQKMGLRPSGIVVGDAESGFQNVKSGRLTGAQVYLWPGSCNVHQRFLPEHVREWRRVDPEARIIVHPECQVAVVDAADDVGSTSHIIRCVSEAGPGSRWAIGTEFNLVDRLRREHPDQSISSLSPDPSYCDTMNLVTTEKLLFVLEELQRHRVVNEVTVAKDVAEWAAIALERMLDVSR
jgi:quinolinate synthase